MDMSCLLPNEIFDLLVLWSLYYTRNGVDNQNINKIFVQTIVGRSDENHLVNSPLS